MRQLNIKNIFGVLVIAFSILITACGGGSKGPIATFNVSAVTNKDYRIESEGLPMAKNPTLTLKRGATYAFKIEAYGHPFLIKTEKTQGTTGIYDTGVTNNGADEGELLFTVPKDAPNILYYVCKYHAMMGGEIKVID